MNLLQYKTIIHIAKINSIEKKEEKMKKKTKKKEDFLEGDAEIFGVSE